MILWGTTALAASLANVLLVEGDATLVINGAEYTAEPGVELEKGAVIKTSDQGALILLLFNDHLVRIDSQLELPIDKIAMLKAPRAQPASIDTQLARLLYPSEREGFGGMVNKVEQLGGWEARMTVGLPTRRGPSKTGSRPKPASANHLVPGPVIPAPQAGGPPKGMGSAGGGRGPSIDELGSGEAPSPPPPPPPPPGQAEPHPLSELLAEFQPGGPRYATCIAPWATDLAVYQHTADLQIHVRTSSGRVTAVRDENLLPLPLCLRDALLDQSATVTGPFVLPLEKPTP